MVEYSLLVSYGSGLNQWPKESQAEPSRLRGEVVARLQSSMQKSLLWPDELDYEQQRYQLRPDPERQEREDRLLRLQPLRLHRLRPADSA